MQHLLKNKEDIERHLFVSNDLPPEMHQLDLESSCVSVRPFEVNEDRVSLPERSLHSVLLISESSLSQDPDKIRDWLHHDPQMLARIVVLGNPRMEQFSPALRENIVLILPAHISRDQLNNNLLQAFNLIQLEFDKLCLSSRLALNTEDLRRISEVSQALSTENDFSKLIDLIMDRALELSNADAGSIYLAEAPSPNSKATHLRFVRSSMQLDTNEFLLPIDNSSIAGHVAVDNKALLLPDVHRLPQDATYSFNSDFDEAYNYYTKSMMVIPMTNYRGDVIGVLQLINRKKDKQAQLTAEQMKGPDVIEFGHKDYELASAIAGQAAVAIDNQRLLDGQKNLLESFIKLIAGAIDSKSAYTGGHCERVPVLTEMLAQAACGSDQGSIKDFNLNEEEWYELRIAAGLHDCGKIVTPVHIMDKSTKLQTIYDRIESVQARFEILKRDTALQYQTLMRQNPDESEKLKIELTDKLEQLNQEYSFIAKMNIGGETLDDQDIAALQQIATRKLVINGQEKNLLNEEEIENLSVRRGTLTQAERLIINAHMVETVKMLEALPFPPNLSRVPEYACGHHEKMDGQGYPKGIYGQDMSIPARIMAIADVFEALTALDRPYKKGKTLSETMQIMGKMKHHNHLDPELFDLFIRSGTYLEYARQYMPPELIDTVDEKGLLAIQPLDYQLPFPEERAKRHSRLLPEYQSFA